MRDIHKNPMVYYLLVPILVGMWPLLVWGVYLPRTERAWEGEQTLYTEGQNHIVEILRLDPKRLELGVNSDVAGEFSYAKAINRVANLCGIAFPDNCNYSAGSIQTSSGKRSQNARVTLTDVDIVRAANFLVKIQSMWINLKCNKVKLTNKGEPRDRWDVEFSFWYYY